MIAQLKIKKLRKRIKKLQKNQDELIKFLGKELYTAVDGFYEIKSTSSIKSIKLETFNNNRNKLIIGNMLTDFRLETLFEEN